MAKITNRTLVAKIINWTLVFRMTRWTQVAKKKKIGHKCRAGEEVVIGLSFASDWLRKW